MPPHAPDEILIGPVSDVLIDEVVQTLNGWQRGAGFVFARQAGNLLVEKLYGGDLIAWRERGTRDTSFRKLAARAEGGDLRLSASALSRCVALVELESRLGATDREHLTVTHVRAVFGLPETTQRKLLVRAEEKGWTIEEIEAAATKARRVDGETRGRPPMPAFVKSIRRLARMLEQDPFGDLDRIPELDADETRVLREALSAMRSRCEEVEARLAAEA